MNAGICFAALPYIARPPASSCVLLRRPGARCTVAAVYHSTPSKYLHLTLIHLSHSSVFILEWLANLLQCRCIALSDLTNHDKMYSLLSSLFFLSFVAPSIQHLVLTYPGSRGDNLVTNGTAPSLNPNSIGIDYVNNTPTFPYGMQWMYPCECSASASTPLCSQS